MVNTVNNPVIWKNNYTTICNTGILHVSFMVIRYYSWTSIWCYLCFNRWQCIQVNISCYWFRCFNLCWSLVVSHLMIHSLTNLFLLALNLHKPLKTCTVNITPNTTLHYFLSKYPSEHFYTLPKSTLFLITAFTTIASL